MQLQAEDEEGWKRNTTHYHCPQEKNRRRRKLAVTRHKGCYYSLSASASCPPQTLLVDESPAISPYNILSQVSVILIMQLAIQRTISLPDFSLLF